MLSLTRKDLLDPALKVWGFFESYGWYIVIALALIYLLRPYVEKMLQERRAKQRLIEATNPERVSILEVERNRIREGQQRKWLEDSKRIQEEKRAQQRKQVKDN